MNFDTIWETVREKLGYPNIKMPVIEENSRVETAEINMQTKEIVISKEFMDKLKLPPELSCKGISAHEANHYVTCPFDLKTLMLMNHEISKSTNNNVSILSNYFSDIVINLDLVDRGIEEISQVYYAMQSTHTIDETIKALYYLRTSLNFGIMDKKNVALRKLNEINKLDYITLDVDSLRVNARRFAEIMNPLLEADPPNENELGFIDGIDYSKYSSEDIYNAAKDIAEDLSPEEYKHVIDNIKKELPNLPYQLNSNAIKYYENLSKKYSVKVRSTQTVSGSQEHSYSFSKWEAGRSFENVDVFRSYGKVFPGITQEKTFMQKPVTRGEDDSENVPDSLILIDSSGSMPDPSNEMSYAVLGGFCAANFYLKNKRKVAVGNFSCETTIQDFTHSKKKVYEMLARFDGGGTTLDMNKIKTLLTKRKKCDIYIITDTAIDNLNEIENFLSSNNYRANIFAITPFSSTYSGPLNYHTIKNESDIPKIVIKDVKRSHVI